MLEFKAIRDQRVTSARKECPVLKGHRDRRVPLVCRGWLVLKAIQDQKEMRAHLDLWVRLDCQAPRDLPVLKVSQDPQVRRSIRIGRLSRICPGATTPQFHFHRRLHYSVHLSAGSPARFTPTLSINSHN